MNSEITLEDHFKLMQDALQEVEKYESEGDLKNYTKACKQMAIVYEQCAAFFVIKSTKLQQQLEVLGQQKDIDNLRMKLRELHGFHRSFWDLANKYSKALH